MEILGVDFSGAKSDHNTWLAQGSLDEQGLTIRQCSPVSRGELVRRLSALTRPAVASLDFPFSVPLDFAHYWCPDAQTMPELWAAAAMMELEQFVALRDAFVARWGEPKRQCDRYPAYSCLHKVNPNMVPMTFYGMQMLARLWPAGYTVPPLESPAGAHVTLLEAMPGATLKALGLRCKGYKNGARAEQLRKEILDGLADRASVPIKNLEEFRGQCLGSHDCLDALVSAVNACLWARDRAVFQVPSDPGSDSFDPKVLMEGWLYAPTLLQSVA